MSDPEIPAPTRGGPIWSQGSATGTPVVPPPPPPPSGPHGSPGSMPLTAASPPIYAPGATGPAGVEDEPYQPRYARDSGSPLPYMAGSLVLLVLAWLGMRWSAPSAGAGDPVRSSEWWINITAVLLPAEDVRVGAYSETRMWISLALLVLAATAVILWIGRIGSNLRAGQQPFGSFLPIVVFPAWWLLPVTLGITSDGGRSRGDLLVRFLTALAILVIQFLLLRWPLLNRIWRAGALPYDLASILLWLPMMIPWVMLFGSNAYTLLVAGENGRLSDSSWQPTPAMGDWAQGMTRLTSVAILVLLVVVSVIQHGGVAEDRADLEASRARSRSSRMPLLPPGI
ncbi:MAG: hypothetical protein JWO77_554 [Ilumatobacteraceae bacterium]|nr:hypothetical protein [Ilumatobacteraceae bacterium]